LIEFKDGSKCKISETTSILKQEIELLPDVTDVISLINDDNALYITYQTRELYVGEVFRLYNRMCFNRMIYRLHLHSHFDLVTKLFHNVRYHLYHVKIPTYDCHYFCFPLHLEDIKDFQFLIPDVVRIEILQSRLLVVLPPPRYIKFYVKNLKTDLLNGAKFNLLDISKMQSNTECFPLADGYACIKYDVWKN